MTPEPTVGYVLKMFPRYSETFVVNEMLELERRGMPLVIYSLKRPAPGPRHAMLGRLRAPVIYLPESPWRALVPIARAHGALLRRAPGTWLRTLWYVLTRRNWAAMKRFLQSGLLVRDAERRGVRHLHAHFATSATRVAMLAQRLSALSYSFTAHAKDIYLDTQDVDLLRDKILEARFVVTVSDYNRVHLQNLCGAEAASRVTRIYNGVDLEALGPSDRPREPHTVLSVARLVEKKGIHDLIEACAILRTAGMNFTCRIIGDGPLRGALEALVRARGLAETVTFAGALAHERVADELGRAGVFALPCVIAPDGNRDGLPTVILEAMACGAPVVSTRVTGIPEMVEDGVTGLITGPGDPPALAAELARLLADPRLAARMGAAGRRRAEERFSLRSNAGELHARLAAAVTAPRPFATPATLAPRDGREPAASPVSP